MRQHLLENFLLLLELGRRLAVVVLRILLQRMPLAQLPLALLKARLGSSYRFLWATFLRSRLRRGCLLGLVLPVLLLWLKMLPFLPFRLRSGRLRLCRALFSSRLGVGCCGSGEGEGSVSRNPENKQRWDSLSL